MATEKEQAEMEFSGHRTRGSAVNQDRLLACIGTDKGKGKCAVDGEDDRYEGTASIQRGYGGVTVPVGGTFQTDRRTFRSVALGGGVYEALTDDCQKLIDVITGKGTEKNQAAPTNDSKKAGKGGGQYRGGLTRCANTRPRPCTHFWRRKRVSS